MSRYTAVLTAVLVVTLLLPDSVSSQLRLTPQVGLYASVSDLGTVDSPGGALEVGENDSSLALGLTLEAAAFGPIGFRLSAVYGTDSEVPVGGMGCAGVDCDLRSTLLGLTASAVFRPIRSGSPILPYVVAGGGLKRYDFDFQSESAVGDAFDDESMGTLMVGAGLEWNLGGLRGNLEVTDHISGSVFEDGDSQHDFFVMVGIILG